MWYDNLKEKRLWAYFENISAIPRESGDEEGIRQFLLSWAKKHSIEAKTDKTGNVIYYKPATPGMEGKEPILLQGHMDMVCVKTDTSTHDFTKDGIEIVCENGIVRAKDTSLGGDNGIAIAIAMDIFSDEKLQHGPLEALFTISEETGLTGAFGIEKEYISARRMINLDSEEEDIIYIGCAGGIEVDATKEIKWEPVDNNCLVYSLTASGLLGGHSGGEIHKQRANAIKLLARILHRIDSLQLLTISGGTKRNVIPSLASISFVASKERLPIITSIIEEATKEIKGEYLIQDPDISICLTTEEELPELAIDRKLSQKWITSLFLAPHGVATNSLALPGIVETSSNLAIVGINDKEQLYAVSSIRSSVESAKNELAYVVAAAFETCKADIIYSGSYPSWTPNPESKFTKLVAQKYKEFTKKDPIITAIHAGLECGIINSNIEGMDSLSMGPNLFDVHSTKEHLEVESVERISEFVKFLISTI